MKQKSRRKFLRDSAVLAASGMAIPWMPGKVEASSFFTNPGQAVALSTWNFGLQANAEAWKVLSNNGSAIDAVEDGIRLIEADPGNSSVGYGGLPDRDGHVTLDACIMDADGRAGSVTFLEGIMNPISVARQVMEKTPHVMLSGQGALQFALKNGFDKQDLLTESSKKAWEVWRKNSQYQPEINIENHDTIGLICLDKNGDLSGGCSTSGLAYKMHGRVGDSPIIGAALFVDNDIGAAVTTGLGEMVMRSVSSFLVVELMRNGSSPQEACEEAIIRIKGKNPEYINSQVGILAVNKHGETGAFAVHSGFNYAVTSNDQNEVVNSSFLMK